MIPEGRDAIHNVGVRPIFQEDRRSGRRPAVNEPDCEDSRPVAMRPSRPTGPQG